jgi:hypothetical protein
MSTIHAPNTPAAPRRRPLIRLDPGWLFLMAGLTIVAATILIPAAAELDEARWQRNKAMAIQRHREARLERYGQYLAAVQRGDDDIVLSLLATQLNMSPADRVPLMPPDDPRRLSASPFPALEPDPMELPLRPLSLEHPSLLTRLTTNDRDRLWLLAGGALCILIGVLPSVSSAVLRTRPAH